jgi:hypothetical protein
MSSGKQYKPLQGITVRPGQATGDAICPNGPGENSWSYCQYLWIKILLGGFWLGRLGGLVLGSFDELAVDEGRPGADERDQVRCVDHAPAANCSTAIPPSTSRAASCRSRARPAAPPSARLRGGLPGGHLPAHPRGT